MSAKKEFRPTELRTPECRFAFPSVFKPRLNEQSGQEKYETALLFPKDSTDMKPFKEKIKQAIMDKWPNEAKRPKKIELPIHDGDEKDLDGYAGHWYINVKSDYKPLVVGTKKDSNGRFIELDENEFYAGCYGRVILNAFAYENKRIGVSFGLGNIQKTRDGERFGGAGSKAEDDFGDTPETTEDESSVDNEFGF